MAVVEYSCKACGLLSEELFRSKAPTEIACPACGGVSERSLSDFGFKFGNGKTPGNTGVESLDRDYDKLIGRDAETRWESVKDRNSRKQEVQRAHGGKVPLRINSHGEYEPMSEKEVKKFQRLHKIGSDAIADGKKSETSE